MTFEPGTTVRTTIDLRADDGSIVPAGTVAMVVGSVDARLVVDFDDHDTGERITATAEPWELMRLRR